MRMRRRRRRRLDNEETGVLILFGSIIFGMAGSIIIPGEIGTTLREGKPIGHFTKTLFGIGKKDNFEDARSYIKDLSTELDKVDATDEAKRNYVLKKLDLEAEK